MTVALACTCFGHASVAGQLALGAGGGVEYTSNPTHIPEDSHHDVIRSVFAGLAYRERTPELTARIDGLAEYRDYRYDSYGEEVVGDLDAFVTWGIVPQTFLWRFVDRYHQATIDPLVVDTPANRTNTNIAATGPDLLLRLGARNTLLIGGRVADVAVQDSVGGADLDNNRYSGHTGWRYDLSSATSVSLNYSGIKVDYDDSVANENFVRHDYFMRLHGRPGPTRYDFDWGTTRIYRDVREPLSGRLARLMLGRQIASNTDIRLRLASEFSDTGGELSPLVDPESWEGAITLLPAVLTTDIFYSKRADLIFNRTGQLGLNVGLGWRELDYEIEPDDNQSIQALLGMSYRLSPRTTSGLSFQYRHTKWLEQNRTEDRYAVVLRLGWQLNRYWTTNFWVGHDAQDSTDLVSNYADSRVGMNVVYRTHPLFSAR